MLEKFNKQEHGLQVLFSTTVALTALPISHFDLVVHFDIPDSFGQYEERLRQTCNKEESPVTSIMMLTKTQIKERKIFLENITERVQTLAIQKGELVPSILYHAQNALKRHKKLRVVSEIVLKHVDEFPSSAFVEEIMGAMALPTEIETVQDDEKYADELRNQIDSWKQMIRDKQQK
jgi:superfamily II DNA/RNA helicase